MIKKSNRFLVDFITSFNVMVEYENLILMKYGLLKDKILSKSIKFIQVLQYKGKLARY